MTEEVSQNMVFNKIYMSNTLNETLIPHQGAELALK